MNADALLKMAQLQTLVDCLELLLNLRLACGVEHHKRIDEMTMRLSNMSKTL